MAGSTAMKRTTILVEEDLLLEARQLAAQRGMTFTAVVQEALREYITVHRPQRRISFMGMGHSGQPPPDLRDGRDEEILATEIDPARAARRLAPIRFPP